MKRVCFLTLFILFLIIQAYADGEPQYCDQNGHCWYQGDNGVLYDNKGHYLYPREDTAGNAQQILTGMGAVPAGSRPKAVIEEGDQPGYYQTDPTSNLKREIEGKQTAKEYQELLDKGYSDQDALEAMYQKSKEKQ